MKSNNLASKLPQQLHVALDDNQLLPIFRVQGDFEHLCQYIRVSLILQNVPE